MSGSHNVSGAHKNMIAVIRVSAPVMIISLEDGECIGEISSLILPLPRPKSSSVCVQDAKADESDDNLSCSVDECLEGERYMAFKPIPFIKSVEERLRRGQAINHDPYTNTQHEPFALSAYKTWN